MASVNPLHSAKTVVIKIGSALLVDGVSGGLRESWLAGLLADVAALRAADVNVVLVSSGSIALGRGVLQLPLGALPLEQSQAAAAVGQIRLARAYEEGLRPHGVHTAQVLVTLEDSEDRRRYLNSRATLRTLLGLGVVPIVNENDTVATDEIRYGDNDRLAAGVAALVGADALVLLSDVDGLYTANPRQDADAQHIPVVEQITPDIMAMAGGAGTAGAKGGMKTKVLAAEIALRAGCAMAICLGDRDRPLTALKEGARTTWFLPTADPGRSRKLWISAMVARGQIVVDAGAAAALAKGKSLLPAGVRQVTGRFGRGDAIDIVTPDGGIVCRAIAGYDADELSKIAGAQSGEIEALLGHPGRAFVVHRDDMAI
ncbi:glutamate 5-kinase [Pontivivens insulae]|uniref:Glutamate 5-kinase n=1 Tax=Pontivivens insulae TaxID=1639689 RepID=A0A2R8ABN4_9RHOB|nr:glutamate 5-kinase [Pontivivens insulae]RED11200.1 glutamate 5-kinase [Pontivivens insulae]SPF29627.1 Glutamate 5-kinase [Pontivivens insulae]